MFFYSLINNLVKLFIYDIILRKEIVFWSILLSIRLSIWDLEAKRVERKKWKLLSANQRMEPMREKKK